MNSHQRRTSRRYWKHHTDVDIRTLGRGLMIVDWCEKNFGNRTTSGRWAMRAEINRERQHIDFWFHNSKDCAMFNLLWL